MLLQLCELSLDWRKKCDTEVSNTNLITNGRNAGVNHIFRHLIALHQKTDGNNTDTDFINFFDIHCYYNYASWWSNVLRLGQGSSNESKKQFFYVKKLPRDESPSRKSYLSDEATATAATERSLIRGRVANRQLILATGRIRLLIALRSQCTNIVSLNRDGHEPWNLGCISIHGENRLH